MTRRAQKPSNGDRLPPHAPEAEQGILGCCLLDALLAMNACEEAGLRADWFYDLRHARIWAALAGLRAAGQPAGDVIAVQQWLKDRNELEEVGGLLFLSGLPDVVSSAANIGYYLDIVREKWQLRRLLQLCVGVGQRLYEFEGQAGALLGEVEADVAALAHEGPATGERRILELVTEVQERLSDYHRGRAQVHGLTTGLEYVDKLLCGLGGDNGNFVVLSGRPGTGKTSLAMQIAAHVACDQVWWEPVLERNAAGELKPVVEVRGEREVFKATRRVGRPVGVFSLEMKDTALVMRTLFQRAGADLQRWRTGFAENEAVQRLTEASNALVRQNHLIVDDTPRARMDGLRAKARRWTRQFGVKLLVVDYVQLVRSAGRRFREDRVQELAEISGEFYALGKELNVPIILLAQMNRDFEKEPSRQPRLSDLKDCGSLEQDADVVGFLYQPKLGERAKDQHEDAMARAYPGGDWSKRPVRVNLLVAKNRYGPTGICQLLFQKSCTRFYDWNVWLKSQGTGQAELSGAGLLPAPEDA